MAAKPKAEPKPKPKMTDKKQSERFIAAARELGLDEDSNALDRAFEKVKIAQPKAPTNANNTRKTVS
jgi:hypothetical protein